MRQPAPAATGLNLTSVLLSAPSNRAVSLREGRPLVEKIPWKTSPHLERDVSCFVLFFSSPEEYLRACLNAPHRSLREDKSCHKDTCGVRIKKNK